MDEIWAYTIDLIVVFSINGILLSPLKVVTNGTEMNLGAWTLAGILGVIILYGYFVVMTKYFGQTIGKMILGLKVIRKDFEPLQWSDLIFREVVGRFFYRVLAWTGILYLVVAFDQRKRGIHDMIGDTIVIHEK
ncbi:RDD family protein [Paracerasibacillus soli]|uniref:RDD family protein n=1 Tax=Paracerasibacillus soli TaxID=480284 RepID=A0ABU5CNC0_9BACI|nr:RDD family protein [Virgibacillus soli]MDY0407735.1 RDD family protein [Virgibacillus soli]